MSKDSDFFSEIGVLTGAMAATLVTTLQKQPREGLSPAGLPTSEPRPEAQEAAMAARLQKIEARLEEHGAKLTEIPSAGQLVGAMEQLVAKMVSSLDERFASQARSIEVLKGSVTQTDRLLERVLESLDSLQSAGPLDLGGDSPIERQVG